jgi:fumarate hydratase subunit beta
VSRGKGQAKRSEKPGAKSAGAPSVSAEPVRVTAPLGEEAARSLRAGQRVLISGTAYTARDAAHKRMTEILAAGGALPFDISGALIYYAGPTPARPGRPIGAIGPTTSSRMDRYVGPLLAAGLRGMIGKGERSVEVRDLLARHGAVYFAATGGAGALLAKHVKSAEVIAWPELGAEAVRRIELIDFPALVACDATGGDLYGSGRETWRRE